MALLTPNEGETRDDFITRCKSDEKMKAQFTGEKLTNVAGNLYDHGDKLDALALSLAAGHRPSERAALQFRSNPDESYSWDTEVFAVGTWNGYNFTLKDLEAMVDSFDALNGAGYLEAPLKFGHNDEQAWTDGHPALGWVEKLYIKKDEQGRDKLMATFANVPKVVYDSVLTGRYRKVSIELEFDVKHKGTMYSYVLTGVALLGADLPAVNTLADLTAYMSRDSMVSAKRVEFSAIKGNLEQKDTNMAEIDDKELADLRAKAAKVDKLEGQVAEFSQNAVKAKVEAARNAVEAVFTKAVSDMLISPAQKTAFSKALKVDDDDAVLAIDVADVEALIPEKPAASGKSFSSDGQQQEHSTDSVDDRVDTAVQKVINESGGKMKYSVALERVYAADPELAKLHLAN